MSGPKLRALVIGLIASLLLCLSMLGTPMLTAASSSIETNKDVYRVGDVMTITVRDPNANVNRFFADTIEVIVKSTSDPGGIKVVLTETGTDTGVFKGSVLLSGALAVGLNTLYVKPGDEITIVYGGITHKVRVASHEAVIVTTTATTAPTKTAPPKTISRTEALVPSEITNVTITTNVTIPVAPPVKVVNESLEELILMLKELKEDLKTLKDSKMALVRIQAVASIIAEKAYEEAKAGNLEDAKELALTALNMTRGVIKAYDEKAEVVKKYSESFENICEALAELIRAYTGSS